MEQRAGREIPQDHDAALILVRMLVSLSPEIALHTWTGENIAYDRVSGDTHLLDNVAAAIIEILLMRPRPPDELLSILLQRETDMPEGKWQLAFEACIANLLTLGVLRVH